MWVTRIMLVLLVLGTSLVMIGNGHNQTGVFYMGQSMIYSVIALAVSYLIYDSYLKIKPVMVGRRRNHRLSLIKIVAPVITTVATYWFLWVYGLAAASDLVSNKLGLSPGLAVAILIGIIWAAFWPNYILMKKFWVVETTEIIPSRRYGWDQDRGHRDPEFPASRP